MARPITIFTAQYGDLPSEELFKMMSEIGYEGLELACGACESDDDPLQGHFDVHKALDDPGYCDAKKAQLAKYGLQCWAISNHCVGQGVLDNIDSRNLTVIPGYLHGDGTVESVRALCAEEMKATARAAAKFGVKVVNGFTGSSIWQYLYSFPPVPQSWIDDGFKLLKERWTPILDVFQEVGVKFALEVHPTEIAFDLHSAQLALEALDYHPAFGFNFDPSHLLWQGVDPVKFIRRFPDRIFHVHMKDVALQLDGENGILGSHIKFGDYRRGWEFRSLGHGHVKFDEIIRALNDIKYEGPLSVEWEDQR
ncbi:MAG: sugar phosphate isomerase/epimerase, partial [Thermoguttaceae bacterium]|nr:sugar phosphate isomerase/epimerase [Thermoguttaceae bacterium]